MEIKTIQPVLVLSRTLKTTLKTLAEDIGNLPAAMSVMISEAGSTISGPQIWIYHCNDGNPESEIQLEITFPINKTFKTDNQFVCKELPEFRCISAFNNGPWNEVGKTYEHLMSELAKNDLIPTFVSREVYIHCDFENQANCITEVQLGIV